MKNLALIYRSPLSYFPSIRSYGEVLLGSCILAIGYVVFIVPHHIVPGGIFGLSIVIKELGGLSIGMTALIINIPLLIIGSKILGTSTGYKTAFSMVTVSVLVDGITLLTSGKVYVTDVLVSSIFGGVLIGLAVFIVMKAGATTGGNDILVRIISKKVKLPYTSLILIVDGVVVLLGVLVFGDFTLAAYCVIAIVSISKTIEHFLKRSTQNRTVLIFSKTNQNIKEVLLSDLAIKEGLIRFIHQDSPEKMVLVTRDNKDVDLVEQLIYKVDPEAQISILDSHYRL
ncbi:MAG: uncharacterized membrane-anchored protein YitT (DUF2179 family) [Salibacteraceae bacterium]|jgi:uncharacterized membrane-anchored protein YitT (DUF2179 family)